MKKLNWPAILLGLNLAIVCGVMIGFLTVSYPRVGADYRLALPSLLDSALHFRLNGLSIQWYTPSFGGGLPAYPDPNNTQFSIWTALTLLVPPLQAVILAAILFICVGGIAAGYCLRRILKLDWPSSILGAIFFSANGFMMQRLAVGHLGYQAFPLLAVFLVLLLDPSLSIMVAGLIFSLLVALLIQQAGYFLIVVFGLSLLMVLPLVYIFRPAAVSFKRAALIILVGGGLALLMSLSKLSAVIAFTRFFPRLVADHYLTPWPVGLLGVVLQLLGTMNLAPLIKIIGGHAADLQAYLVATTGANYGYWEFDMSLSPAAFGILIAGLYGFARKPGGGWRWFRQDRRWLAWILLGAFTWLTIEFSLGKGLIYPLLQKLPVLSSLHVNVRFAAALILPVAIGAALIYDHWSCGWQGRKAWLLFLGMDVISLLPLGVYFLIRSDLQARLYDVSRSQAISQLIRSGDPMTIRGIASGLDNTQALLLQESNLQPYEPIFGYYLEDFHPEIHAGSIWDVSGGYYNMTNPTGYVFPEINHSRPFERIPVDEKAELLAFARHEQPDWRIPLYQRMLDWVSGGSLLVVLAVLVYAGVRKMINIKVR